MAPVAGSHDQRATERTGPWRVTGRGSVTTTPKAGIKTQKDGGKKEDREKMQKRKHWIQQRNKEKSNKGREKGKRNKEKRDREKGS